MTTPLRPSGDHQFRVRQDGMTVAEVSGPNRLQCLREIMHYAMVYGQDGPCTVEGIEEEDWLVVAEMVNLRPSGSDTEGK